MPVRAQIADDWVERTEGSQVYRFPRVTEAHQPISWIDATGQPAENILGSPNVLVLEGVWSDAEFALMQADPMYASGILWSEPA